MHFWGYNIDFSNPAVSFIDVLINWLVKVIRYLFKQPTLHIVISN